MDYFDQLSYHPANQKDTVEPIIEPAKEITFGDWFEAVQLFDEWLFETYGIKDYDKIHDALVQFKLMPF